MPWTTAGLQTNPSSGVTLADTGAVASPVVLDVVLLASSSARVGVEIQHRNATNTGNVWQHAFLLAADAPLNLPLPVTVAAGERVRLVTITAVASGQVQGSLRT